MADLCGTMPMTIRVRALGEGEAAELARMARSRTLGAGLVRRAQIVQHAVDGLSAPGAQRGHHRGAVAPRRAGLPFASWTLDRLVAYLGEKGIGMKRSRVGEVLLGEGLKW